MIKYKITNLITGKIYNCDSDELLNKHLGRKETYGQHERDERFEIGDEIPANALSVNEITEYEKDAEGNLIYDENGDKIIYDNYLMARLPQEYLIENIEDISKYEIIKSEVKKNLEATDKYLLPDFRIEQVDLDNIILYRNYLRDMVDDAKNGFLDEVVPTLEEFLAME